MTEDSKKLAGAGSTGVELHLEKARVPSEIFKEALDRFIMSWAKDLEGRGALIGHVKMIAEVDLGYYKLSVVDVGLGVEKDDGLEDGNVTKGRVRIMAAVLNLDDEEVERSLEKALEGLSRDVHFHKAGHQCAHGH
ncbi:MAG: hypothetical protein HPY73_02900 [Methanomassiliicoccales archaeon]|nr:MAG: hypothetical protein HPY73_02900 [Methanomassiliicoccales archaeon]